MHLQHKVRELEEELARVENEDSPEDPEAMMRAANVHVDQTKEPKFLGPSSGIAITRVVMSLAKQFTDVKSIKDIVPDQQARHIKELYNEEQSKPTSKSYPMISDVPANSLPNRDLTNMLVRLYKLKVQAMYPALHEPTMEQDIEDVYNHGDSATHYQHFVCRMVIAISLQKMDTQFAGLADSYYLAALQHLKDVVKPMDLKTLQCFALMAEYSMLTPTRTAIYYVVGIAVRLAQALGYNEERMITRGRGEERADPLEIDMRRRLFWCIMVMDLGLAHSLGRPAMLATGYEHLDVQWFDTTDDVHIKREGITPNAPRPTLKKWIAIHFFKMRMLQLEIRRKLYLTKKGAPRKNSDPWFDYMDSKLIGWRDAAPSAEMDIGLDKKWFHARYNTMVVFLYRPSPAVPRPSLEAAQKCFEACKYNIHVQREQIEIGNVDMTWIFTQSIFMAINTMLWSLSYEEVRQQHSREDVSGHLDVAMEAIGLATSRWPGVASAVQLYQNLIGAILRIYDKDGDVPISAATPSDMASPPPAPYDGSRSRGASPATVASSSVATPPDRSAPFGYIDEHTRNVEQPQAGPSNSRRIPVEAQRQAAPHPAPYPVYQPVGSGEVPTMQSVQQDPNQHHQHIFDPYNFHNPLPDFSLEALTTVPTWTTTPMQHPQQFGHHAPMQPHHHQDPYAHQVFNPNANIYPFPGSFEQQHQQPQQFDTSGNMYGFAGPQQQQQPHQQQQYYGDWDMNAGNFGVGLNQMQQEELMHELETDGMEGIQSIIEHTLASITPKGPQAPTFQ